MKVKQLSSKTSCVVVLFAILLTVSNVCVINASSQAQSSPKADGSSLSEAFFKLSELPTFEKINSKEYDYLFPVELGESQGLMAPNSHLREDILKILKEIPYRCLYSESRAQNDDISRCYIESLPFGQYQMMYVVVGHGSNDVVVAFFTGGSIKQYEDFGDSFKQASFTEVEDAVVKTNAECPIVLGTNMEMSSMYINERYWTVRMKINTLGVGLTNINREQVIKMLKGVSKYQVSQVFNLDIGLKMVYTSEKGETITINLEHEDLAEILNDTDITSDDVLQTYIDNNKNACPLKIAEGMYMTDVLLVENVLVHEITIDENLYSIEQINANSSSIKQEMLGVISSGQDQSLSVIADLLIKVNKGLAYAYVGHESEKMAVVIISCEELKYLLSD